MINHEFKLDKEGREDIKWESDCENVESVYFYVLLKDLKELGY